MVDTKEYGWLVMFDTKEYGGEGAGRDGWVGCLNLTAFIVTGFTHSALLCSYHLHKLQIWSKLAYFTKFEIVYLNITEFY